MYTINRSQLPCSEANLRAALASYLAAKDKANKREGTPSPFPEYEIIRLISERGGELTVVEDPVEPAPPPLEVTP